MQTIWGPYQTIWGPYQTILGPYQYPKAAQNRQKLQKVDQQLANVAKVAPEEHWDEMSPLNRDNMSPGT